MIAMFTAIYSTDPLMTLWKGFEVFVHVSLAFALSVKINKNNEIQYLSAILCIILLFLTINLLISSILFPQEALQTYMYTAYGKQQYFALVGVFPKIHPNSSSQIGAMFALLSISYLMVSETTRRKLTSFICLTGGFIVMLLGHARTSNIAFFITLTFIILSFGRFKNKFILIFLALLMCSLAFVINDFMDPVYDYLRRGQSQTQLFSLTGRIYIWKIAIVKFLKQPWLGYGYYSGPKAISSRMIAEGSNLDNTYLNVLIGGGLLLFLPLILSVWQSLVVLWKSKQKAVLSSANRLICIQATSIFIIIFVRSFSGPTFEANHFNLIFFLLCSLIFSKIIENPV